MKGFIIQMIIGIMFAASLLVVVAAYRGARRDAEMHTCVYSLRVLEEVKKKWAEENAKKYGEEVHDSDLRNYFKDQTMPSCEAGGNYTIGPVGTPPTCSIKGHVLPDMTARSATTP